jgi:hypothetical protein
MFCASCLPQTFPSSYRSDRSEQLPQWTLPSAPIQAASIAPGVTLGRYFGELCRLFGDVGAAITASSFAEAGLRGLLCPTSAHAKT